MPTGIYKHKKRGLMPKWWKEKISKTKIGYPKPKNAYVFPMGHKINNGRKVSQETRIKLSISHKGEKSWRWKGGITPLVLQIRHCFESRQWRSDVFTRDDFTCQNCGDNKGGNLEAHHLKRVVDIIREHNIKALEEALKCEEMWNTNNGRTLCKKCHHIIHKT